MHLLRGFAHADAPDGNARQPHRGHHPGRFLAQVGVAAALNDAKQGLVALVVGGDAALQPTVGSPAGSGHIGFAGRIGGALVKGHGHIGPQGHLDLHGALGSQLDASPIPGGSEDDAVVVDGVDVAQAEHLESARVGQQGAVPAHETMQPARISHDLLAGLQV